jgi:hypothetical protein
MNTRLAPGDRLREWWDGLSRVQKWGFGILMFGALALLPLYTPPFLDTPGISFGGTMAQFAMVAIIAIGLNVVVGQASAMSVSTPSARTPSHCSPAPIARGTSSGPPDRSVRRGRGCPACPWRWR